MEKIKLYITRSIPNEAVDTLRDRCDVTVNPHPYNLSTPELIEACKDMDAMIVLSTQIDEDFCASMEKIGKLKIMANFGVGYDNLDVEACTRHGIFASNCPHAVTAATADMAFTLLAATARKILPMDKYVRAKGTDWSMSELLGKQVSGAKLGIIGAGRIGTTVGRRATGFDMEIAYSDAGPRPDFEKATGGRYMELDELLAWADFVSVHVPLSPASRHLIGERELALMKPDAIIVNTARGPIIDEAALVKALQSGAIAGAGLDVFEDEPHVSPELLEMDNVVLTPHMGTFTLGTRILITQACADNIYAAMAGELPPTCLNPQIYGK